MTDFEDMDSIQLAKNTITLETFTHKIKEPSHVHKNCDDFVHLSN
jgi:hypothetical protein